MNHNTGMPNLSSGQIDMLLRMASAKLGVSPEKLKTQLQKGDLPQGITAQNVQQLLNDPKKLEMLLSSDKAKKALQDFMGGR